MSQQQTLTAAVDGLGTYKSSGANLADSPLLTILGLTAFPQGFYGALDIRVVTGTLFVENDGTAADANVMQFDAGEKWEVRNCASMASKIRAFANAAYDIRITLYSGGTP